MSIDFTATPTSWQNLVNAFAARLKKPASEVHPILEALVDADDDGITNLGNEKIVTDAAIVFALRQKYEPKDLKDSTINGAIVNVLRAKPAEIPAAPSSSGGPNQPVNFNLGQVSNLLPKLEDDKSFLESLSVGGYCKVDSRVVVASIRSYVAHIAGLFDVPRKIRARLDQVADELTESFSKEYYEVDELIEQVDHSRMCRLAKVPGKFAKEEWRLHLLNGIRTQLLPALRRFLAETKEWHAITLASLQGPGALAFSQMYQNPAAMQALAALQAPPDITSVIESARQVNNYINLVHSKAAIPASKAMAYTATEIVKLIEPESEIHKGLGYGNREQMIAALGFATVQDVIRSETALARFTLGVMDLPKQANDLNGLFYVGQLMQLGSQIKWAVLGVPESAMPVVNPPDQHGSFAAGSSHKSGRKNTWDANTGNQNNGYDLPRSGRTS